MNVQSYLYYCYSTTTITNQLFVGAVKHYYFERLKVSRVIKGITTMTTIVQVKSCSESYL